MSFSRSKARLLGSSSASTPKLCLCCSSSEGPRGFSWFTCQSRCPRSMAWSTLTKASFAFRRAASVPELLEFCALPDAVAGGFAMPIISSARRFCFCSGVSCHAELSFPRAFGSLALFPVLKAFGRCFKGSIRAARSSCLGAIIIHSSLRGLVCEGSVVGGALLKSSAPWVVSAW